MADIDAPQSRIGTGETFSSITVLADATITGDLDVTGETTTIGDLLIGNGSAGDPSLAFASDPNTGIYRPAEDQFGVAAGGTRRMSFASPSWNFNNSNLVSVSGGDFSGTVSTDGFLDLGSDTELTLVSNVITATKSFHKVTGESAADDDIDTITATTVGRELTLVASSDSVTITAKDGVGNLLLAGDFAMDNASDTLKLISDGTSWLEVSRSSNGA